MEEKKSFFKGFMIGLIIAIIILAGGYYYLTRNANEKEVVEQQSTSGQTAEKLLKNEYAVTDNNFSKFDLSFLKFENKKENKIYSPLSIKYAFKMLEEGTEGESGKQISDIIEAYNLTEYKSNKNMALANAFFIRDTYKANIKEDYIDLLKTKYDADIEFDSFSSAKKINSWVNNHTLELIPELLDDSDLDSLDFALINALGIDMEWKHKFLINDYDDDKNITRTVFYNHAKKQNDNYSFSWTSDMILFEKKFDNNQQVSSMRVDASLNNYDAVKELGEENIRNTVYADFKDWALGKGEYTEYNGKDDETFKNDFSEEGIKKAFDNWFDNGTTGYWEGSGKSYIDELNENKGRVDYSTDFSVYVDDDVKVFAKDLDEYDGTTLQYIGIMPIKEELNKYVENTDHEEILGLISKLKDLKRENFRDGYLTYIHGYIPKFNFEYELNLQEDLEKMGVTDVFTEGKANLSKMTDVEGAYINSAKHKANIEFTQDGIKAAAATMAGGAGAGDWYDYFIEMPTEEIDITFDKPYMFLIRDKKTGETWFVGTVYEPLDIKEETGDNTVAYEDRVDLDD